jgi:hypothetical protein
MSLLADLEDDIASRLTFIQGVPNLVVQVVPYKQSLYKKVFTNPTLTVMFKDIAYTAPESINKANQEATVTIEVYLQSKFLRSNAIATGIYQLYDEARKALLGYEPNGGFTKIWGKAFEVVSYEENVFMYCFEIQTSIPVIEQQSCWEQNLPRVTEILYLVDSPTPTP